MADGGNERELLGFDYEHRKEYNKLIEQYKSTPDAAGRKAISGQLQAMYIQDMYESVLYFTNTCYLVNSGKLQGWTGISQDYEAIAVYDFSQWSLVD